MKEPHYDGMRKLLLVIMIVVPSVPFFLVLGIGYFYFTTSLGNSAIATMNRIVDDHQHMIASFLDERKADLRFILHAYSFECLRRPERLGEVFLHLQKSSNAFVDIGVFNDRGVHVAYEGPYSLTGKVYADEDWFREVMEKGHYISDIFLGFRQAPHFIIALAREEAGERWVIRSTIDTRLFNELVEKVRIGKTGEAYIVNARGVFQTTRRSGGQLMEADPDHAKYLPYHDGIRTFLKKDITGETFLYATAWLKNGQWQLVARRETADAFADLGAALYRIALITLIGVVGIVVAAVLITDYMVGRIRGADVRKDEMEQQLFRAHRLAELGEMAAGFAHEINNPLQIVKSEQALMEMNLADLAGKNDIGATPELAEINDSMSQIKLQLNRCAGITQAILKFGRQDEPKAQELKLQSFVPEVIDMVAKKASVSGIQLKQVVSAETPVVKVDSGQLQQVLLNLLNNAMDAVVERHGLEGGEVTVSVGEGKNGKAQIRVADNGCGISVENQAKIFSPFFTTKPVGKGTGLGLSVCHGIIGNMGGTIDMESAPGKGTVFTVRIPGKSS